MTTLWHTKLGCSFRGLLQRGLPENITDSMTFCSVSKILCSLSLFHTIVSLSVRVKGIGFASFWCITQLSLLKLQRWKGFLLIYVGGDGASCIKHMCGHTACTWSFEESLCSHNFVNLPNNSLKVHTVAVSKLISSPKSCDKMDIAMHVLGCRGHPFLFFGVRCLTMLGHW
ncbi:uncharacterized protein [Elaeis guineensis]|uniref:uncharacterized protein n=1 Tax=Elaeis guineensis var. tenera TaxID=51953 RepID=UPI003C6D6467